MKTYAIYKDGFKQGVARGKRNAVDRVKKELEYEGIIHLAKWSRVAGQIRCDVVSGVTVQYTIDEERGN